LHVAGAHFLAIDPIGRARLALDAASHFQNFGVVEGGGGGAGTGTVTSVAMSVPSVLTVAGSPITTSGTLAVTYSGTPLPVVNGGFGNTDASVDGGNY
jgi:hypothetical protein